MVAVNSLAAHVFLPVEALFRYRFPIGGRIFHVSARTEASAFQAAEDIALYLQNELAE